MKAIKRHVLWLFAVVLIFSFSAHAQVLKGELSGTVVDEKGESLPGANIVLTGEKLFQNSLSVISNDKGAFRFANLNPGNYSLEISLPGFNNSKFANIVVNVGKTTSIQAKLLPERLQNELVVVAKAPLIDATTTQISTNYSTESIEKIPTSRNMLDLLESTAGINDGGAYGAGGKEVGTSSPWSSKYSQGAGTNTYRLNGVDVSSVRYGDSPVNPNYDTIDEIEIVGIGASAEYGNFIGTTVNVVTKSGGNRFHGGVNVIYTDSHYSTENSGNILDLKHPDVNRDGEVSLYFSGPIIKEKLFFFLAGGYMNKKSMEYASAGYGEWKQQHYYAKLDGIVDKRNSFSLMFNQDPMNNDNLGLTSGSGPEIAYSDEYRMTSIFGSWRTMFSPNSFVELKGAYFSGMSKVVPVSGDVPSITNSLTGVKYGSSGWNRDDKNTRQEIDLTMTQYADDLLGANHSFKAGIEYENAKDTINEAFTGGALISMRPLSETNWLYYVITGSDTHSTSAIKRFSGFVQDNVTIGKHLALNLGVRFDNPRLTANGVSGTIASFNSISPRLGFSYDFKGDSDLVFHAHYGRYNDKMRVDSFKTAIPGMTSMYYYMGFYDSAITSATPELVAELQQSLLFSVDLSTTYRVDPNLKAPYSDVFSFSLEKKLSSNFSVSVDYINKTDKGILYIADNTEHTFEAVEWTDSYTNWGKTITLYQRTDDLASDWMISNSNWAKRKHQFLTVTLKKQPSARWMMTASFTYQKSVGNVDNMSSDYNSTLFGLDQDPNYTQNPLRWGNLSFSRPYQFKFLGGYQLPLGISITGDFRWMSGRHWNANGYWGEPDVIGLWASGMFPLEQRGSRITKSETLLNLRLAKSFVLKGTSMVELCIDVFNVFNSSDPISGVMEVVQTHPDSTWNLTAGEMGDAFGKASRLIDPRTARFSLRWKF